MLNLETQLKRRPVSASILPQVCGTPEQQTEVYMELVGLAPPRDLTWDWPVQNGINQEPLIRRFYEHDLGYKLVDVGRVYQHPELPISATIDGIDQKRRRIVEIKTTAWSLHWAETYYLPQFLIQQECVGINETVLVISVGGREYVDIEIPDPGGDYRREMHARIASFLLCLKTLTPPYPLPKLVPPEQYRSVDLRELPRNAWPNWASVVEQKLPTWGETLPSAQSHADADRQIKELIPDDVGAFFHGDYSIKRNRRGALTIKRAA